MCSIVPGYGLEPTKPLLKAIANFTEALILDSGILISYAERDIEGMIIRKLLHSIRICIQNHLSCLQKYVGTIQNPTSHREQNDHIHRTEHVSVAFGILIKVDAFLPAVRRLQKSQTCRNPTSIEFPDPLENESET
ncbi:Uncharacterized protein HZ326_11571 [Fusarium oxysporum f. sp. albedinis]|nr:Uncharacterized protein HZ326_11571 [Fusarium oxysporum f. sp. albedinis]